MTPLEVLGWIHAVSPALWFASEHARSHGLCREGMNDPLWTLRQSGPVIVGDWVRGRGQGYVLTDAGRDMITATRSGPSSELPLATESFNPQQDIELPIRESSQQPTLPLVVFTAYDRGEQTREAFLTPRSVLLSPGLLVILTALFIVQILLAINQGIPIITAIREGSMEVLLRLGAASAATLIAGEWWRLVIAIFLNSSIFHLLSNLLPLGLLLPVAEGLWGRHRLIILLIMSGIHSTALTLVFHPTAVVTGSIGATWGIFSAVLFWLVFYRQYLPRHVFVDWLRRMVFVGALVLCWQVLTKVHVTSLAIGAISGIVVGLCLDLTRTGRKLRLKLFAMAMVIFLIAGSLSVLAWQMIQSPNWQKQRDQEMDLSVTQLNQIAKFIPVIQFDRVEQLNGRWETSNAQLKSSLEDETAQLVSAAKRFLQALEPMEGLTAIRLREYLAELIQLANDWPVAFQAGQLAKNWTARHEKLEKLWQRCGLQIDNQMH